MDFIVLTIFPELFVPFWNIGIIRRAIERRIITGQTIFIRDFAEGKHHVTDDRPYGGGSGMIMKPEPLFLSIQAAKKASPDAKTILLTPQGRPLDQEAASELAELKGLILVCGRYEGIDERICYDAMDDELSIGDFVLSGGEVAAMVIIDAVTRLIPGALGAEDGAENDSFSEGLLEHAHYTRPRSYRGHEVPEVLLSGNHEKIRRWRQESSLIRTFLKRPDLLKNKLLDHEELDILKKWCLDIENIIAAQRVCSSDPPSGRQ